MSFASDIIYEDFLTRIYTLNPVGNAKVAYELMIKLLNSNETLYDGTPITFELLVRRYAEYINYLKPFNSVKDKQYIKKDKEIVAFGEYILKKLFLDDYSKQQQSPNDYYLFGI